MSQMSFRDPNPNLFQLSKDQSFGDFLSAFWSSLSRHPKLSLGRRPPKSTVRHNRCTSQTPESHSKIYSTFSLLICLDIRFSDCRRWFFHDALPFPIAFLMFSGFSMLLEVHFGSQENLDLVEKGCANLIAHIQNVRKHGVKAVLGVAVSEGLQWVRATRSSSNLQLTTAYNNL